MENPRLFKHFEIIDPENIADQMGDICYQVEQLLLQNKGDQVQEKISQDLLTTWCVGAMYWPFVLGINFRYVSLTHRPLVGALAGSAWNIYNSFQANKKTATANS